MLLFIDSAISFTSLFITVYGLGSNYPDIIYNEIITFIILSLFPIFIMFCFGSYKEVTRYFGILSFSSVLKSLILFEVILFLILFFEGTKIEPVNLLFRLFVYWNFQ